MRFGLVHRIMTDALAVLGVLALVTSGKLHLWATLGISLGLLLALALPARYRQEGFLRVMGVVLPLVLLAAQLGRLSFGGDPIPIIVEFAAALQVIRLATRRGAAHDHQVILLSLLHLIAGTVLGGGLSYAVALMGFLVFTPGALVLSHLRREVEGNYRQGARDRTGMPVDVPRILKSRRVIGRGFLAFTCLLSLPVFLFTALMFLAFPRVGLTWLMMAPVRPQRVVGFSDRVDLGGVGTIRSDPALVMRVMPSDLGEDPPLRRNLYLRGALFDSYDGRAWARGGGKSSEAFEDGGGTVILKRHPRRETDRVLKIELEPIEPPVVFLPGEAVALRVLSRQNQVTRPAPLITVGTHGELVYGSVDATGISYEVFLPEAGRYLKDTIRKGQAPRYLPLPEKLSPRVVDLAQIWTKDLEDPEAIARRLEQKLREGYAYDLGSPSGKAADPLDHFLFESKRGHCEFYSTAMAMLLRVRGVPSRNVTGFVGGTFNRFGEFYAVRQGDAHSWVEAYLPKRGWTRFDPTPPSSARPQGESSGALATLREIVEAMSQGWNESVVSFNLEKQIRLFRSIESAFSSVTDSSSDSSEGGRALGKRRKWLLYGGIALLLGAALVLRRPRRGADTKEPGTSAAAQRSIELYQKLDALLASAGVPRPISSPPLAHAQALEAAGHPLGLDATRLTRLYLRARFGGQALSPEEELDFLRTLELHAENQAGRRGSRAA